MIEPFVKPAPRCRLLRAEAFYPHRLMFLLLAVCVAFDYSGSLPVFANPRSIQEQNPITPRDKIRVLAPGEIIRQKMRRGEAHAFQLSLAPQQFAQIIVEQQGIDVAVRVSGPDGHTLIEMDSPNGLLGSEVVSVVAQLSGSYIVEVLADKTMPDGSYELRVEGLRESLPADKRRVEAERLFMAAQKLRFQGTADSRAQAIRKYTEALYIWRGLGDARAEGYTLCNIGRVYRALGVLQKSLDYLNQALLRLRDAQDIPGQAFVLNEVGATHKSLGDPLQALESYERALELRSSIGDQWGQAQIFNNVGIVYFNTGHQQKAIENYVKALPLWRAVGDRYMEANTLNNTAESYSEMGDLSYALENFQQVLKFCQERGDSRLEAYVQNNIGKIYDTWAESDTALDHYQKALEIFRGLKNVEGEALVLENIGMVHAWLDDVQPALQYFQDALKIRQQLNEPRGMSVALNNIGYAQTLLGDHEEALKQLDLALNFSRASRNRPFEAYTLVNIGIAYVSLGKPQKALEQYQQALGIQKELEDRRGQAITLDKIGQANALLGQSSKALESYGQAIQLWIAVGDKQGQALSLYGIARVERDRQNLREARDRVEEAISIVESLRAKMTGHQLRMIYFASKQDYYALDIDVRMRLYEQTRSEADMEAALFASERARARNLLDILNEAHADIHRGVAPQFAERNRQLEQEINVLAQSLLRLRNQKRTEDAAAVEDRLSRLLTEYDNLQAKVKALNVSYADLSQPQPLRPREVQQLLDDDTLLLEYALGEERSYLWAVTRTAIKSYTLPGQAEIEKVAAEFRRIITAYEPPKSGETNMQYLARLRKAADQYPRQALELSRIVLGAVSSQLGNKRLVIIPDGALQYIPFEALPLSGTENRSYIAAGTIGYTPLLLEHEVVYEPSASTLSLLRNTPRRRAASKTVAILADPVFDSKDDRVPGAVKGSNNKAVPKTLPGELSRSLRDVGDVGGADYRLERLRHTAEEANAIIALAPAGSGMKALDFKASRATATSPDLAQFKTVHFATHGILNDKHPELSGIVLSMVNERGQPEDGFLRLRDIYNLNLPVDLVVLSACRTGIGKQVRGEGLIGLTRGFMYAGASRVTASLWKVDDEATAELMKRFYRNMLEKKMPVAAALRQARIEMMNEREQWRAPYYWAGFVLQGDWK
jgi:CHAT domain-containing protein/predicted negative regulator of RcsB-dependent stress response